MEALWLGVAYGLGLGVSAVGLPPLVGYLAGGLLLELLGQSATELLHEVAHLGVLLLLFTVGLKLRLRNLARAEVWATGLLHAVIIAALFTVTLALLALHWQPAAFLAMGLAFSSTVLAAKMLEEKNELRAYHGRIAIGILILQDLLAVALMAVAGAAAVSPWALLLLLLPLARPLLERLVALSGHRELLLLLGLLLAVAGARLFELVGLSGELGALAAGALLVGSRQAEELSDILWGLKEAFLVAFFLEVGLAGLPSGGQLLLSAALLLALPLKAALFFVLLTRARLRARTAFLSALALASYSEFALITGQVGVANGLLDASWLAPIALAVMVSLAVAAPLNRAAHTLYERFEGQLLRFELPERHPERKLVSLGSARFLVVGMGRVGSAAYELLREQGEQVVGIDSDPGKIEAHLERGHRVAYGDAEDPDLWNDLRFGELAAVLLALPDLEAKLRAATALRRRGFGGVIAATSYYPEEETALRDAGVDIVFNPLTDAGARLAALSYEAVHRPAERAA